MTTAAFLFFAVQIYRRHKRELTRLRAEYEKALQDNIDHVRDDRPIGDMPPATAQTLVNFAEVAIPNYTRHLRSDRLSIGIGLAYKLAILRTIELYCDRSSRMINHAAVEIGEEKYFIRNGGIARLEAYVEAIHSDLSYMLDGYSKWIQLLDDMKDVGCKIQHTLQNIADKVSECASSLRKLNCSLNPKKAKREKRRKLQEQAKNIAAPLAASGVRLVGLQKILEDKRGGCDLLVSYLTKNGTSRQEGDESTGT